MTRVLPVRVASLGDVLHTFPAATDLARALSGAVLDALDVVAPAQP